MAGKQEVEETKGWGQEEAGRYRGQKSGNTPPVEYTDGGETKDGGVYRSSGAFDGVAFVRSLLIQRDRGGAIQSLLDPCMPYYLSTL
jgi:hypothetical protein